MIKRTDQLCKCGKTLLYIEQFKDCSYAEKEEFLYCLKCEKKLNVKKIFKESEEIK